MTTPKMKQNIEMIIQSLEYLDFQGLSEQIRNSITQNPNDDALATLAIEMSSYSEEKHNRIVSRLLKLSNMREKCNFEDLLTYPERQLDIEQINDLAELHFVRQHENLILWGPSGTGKTWLSEAILTSACQHHIRCRWISFPALYRLLEDKYKEQQANKKDFSLDKVMKAFARIPLLCIDEFPNFKIEDIFLVQEFFDERAAMNNSTIICSQSSPKNWPDLFEIKSFGQSIRGRLEQNGKVIEMKGPDLRLFKPE